MKTRLTTLSSVAAFLIISAGGTIASWHDGLLGALQSVAYGLLLAAFIVVMYKVTPARMPAWMVVVGCAIGAVAGGIIACLAMASYLAGGSVLAAVGITLLFAATQGGLTQEDLAAIDA